MVPLNGTWRVRKYLIKLYLGMYKFDFNENVVLLLHYYCPSDVYLSLASNFCLYWSPKSGGHRIQDFFKFLSVVRNA